MESKEIKVSIICLIYNQEKYVEKCLDGLVNQKTNFKFEVIVHDDASTDNSKKIIEEFHLKYPDIIVPIYQIENQYSKGVNITNNIIMPKAKGKYIAFCEGDDYWCDNNKLQKQYDFMEKNDSCSICMHNTIIHDLSNNQKDKLFNSWNTVHEMSEEEVFFGWNVHTTSYFIRKEYAIIPENLNKYWFGDYIRLTYAYSKGKAIVLPDVMSVYNFNNTNGLTYIIHKKDCLINFNKIKARKDYLLEFNELTNNKFLKITTKRINEIDFQILILELNNVTNYLEYKEKIKHIKSNEYYLKYICKLSFIEKIKFRLKINSYIMYLIYKIIKKYNSKDKN